MLARLLRTILLIEVLTGAALGYWLHHSLGWHSLAPVALGLATPFLTMLLIDVLSTTITRNRAEPPAMWWRSLVGEMVAGVKIFILQQPWTWQPPTVLPATGGGTKIPVVLVHGYLCNDRIWDDVAADLRAQGHAVFAVNLEPVFSSIDRYAPIIESAVQALLQHTGAKQVALVGHSMGGLAIRGWMRAHGTDRVARVLTLGTPHAGTKLARGATTPNGKQMLWKCQWLAALSASETDTTRQLIRIALTPQDNIVAPQREQVLPGIAPVVFEGLGHLQLCTDAKVMQWVREQLADAANS